MKGYTVLDKIVYIASPYSVHGASKMLPENADAIYRQRFEAATDYAAHLVLRRVKFFAPITMSHPIVEAGGEATWEYWLELDEIYMKICTELHVLQLDGWKESTGVGRELGYFTQNKKPILYISPVTYGEVE